MKKFIIPAVLIVFLSISSTAFAAGTDGASSVITPGSIVYKLDKLFENIQLVFTFNPEKKANLLLQFAQERLLEAKAMAQENKPQYVQEAVKDYISEINKANDTVTQVLTDQKSSSAAKQNLEQEVAAVTEVDQNVENALDDSQKQELDESKGLITAAANVVKNIDTSTVESLREEGLGFGQISQAAVLASQSGKSIEDVASLFKSGSGFGDVAKELGLTPSEVSQKLASTKLAAPNTASEDNNSGETEVSDAQKSSSSSDNTALTSVENDKTSVNQEDTGIKNKPEDSREQEVEGQKDSSKASAYAVKEDNSSSENNDKQEVENNQENTKNQSDDSKQTVVKSGDDENNSTSIENEGSISTDKSDSSAVQSEKDKNHDSERDSSNDSGDHHDGDSTDD